MLKKLANAGGLCDSCDKKVVELCEMLKEGVRDKKLELELEL